MMAGPSGPRYALKIVDCIENMDPAMDPEVQNLLQAGWEPMGVHKFSSFTGASGVRLYFKRAHTAPEHVPEA